MSRRLLFVLCFIAITSLGFAARYFPFVVGLLTADNFYPVQEGVIYRSASMRPEKLQDVINRYHIKTIMDLRTPETVESVATTDRDKLMLAQGVLVKHLPLSVKKKPTWTEVLSLIDFFNQAKTPILIHCSSGAERTAVAASIWLLTHRATTIREDETVREAIAEQFSAQYGYSSLLMNVRAWRQGAPTVNAVIDEYLELCRRTPFCPSYTRWVRSKQ